MEMKLSFKNKFSLLLKLVPLIQKSSILEELFSLIVLTHTYWTGIIISTDIRIAFYTLITLRSSIPSFAITYSCGNVTVLNISI